MTFKNKKRKERKAKRKNPWTKFNNKSVVGFLILITLLLVILLMVELVDLRKKVTNNQPPAYRPVYIVDSQPIDIDAYLRQYFANKVPQKTMQVTVSAYSSTNGQTDDTPYTTAYGTPARDGIAAANFLPVGTVIRFPDKFGDKLFVVEDKMDERFGLQVDIWMSAQEEAKKFGIQYLKMEVF